MAMNMSFAGCGFSGMYHLGVVQCLRKHAPSLVKSLNIVAGASAGAMAAVMLVTEIAADVIIESILAQTIRTRAFFLNNFSPSFDLMGELERNLDKLLPPNAHELATERLRVSLTACSFVRIGNVLIDSFSTRKDLIDAVCCSCYVPGWSSWWPRTFKGSVYFDGGVTDNIPQSFPGETITVSPFHGESDICPQRSIPCLDISVTIANTNLDLSVGNLVRLKKSLILPSALDLLDIMTEGYNNCLSFLQHRGLEQCRSSCSSPTHWRDVLPVHLHHMVTLDTDNQPMRYVETVDDEIDLFESSKGGVYFSCSSDTDWSPPDSQYCTPRGCGTPVTSRHSIQFSFSRPLAGPSLPVAIVTSGEDGQDGRGGGDYVSPTQQPAHADNTAVKSSFIGSVGEWVRNSSHTVAHVAGILYKRRQPSCWTEHGDY